MGKMTTLYTADEVAQHNQMNDLWMVIHGGVYDLTKFLTEHPGGEDVLTNLAGQDGTVCFDDIGHTTEAVQLREQYKIGEMVEGAAGGASAGSPSGAASPPKDDDNWEYEAPKQEKSQLRTVITVVAIAVYAALYYYMIL